MSLCFIKYIIKATFLHAEPNYIYQILRYIKVEYDLFLAKNNFKTIIFSNFLLIYRFYHII
jgi:hypothetical protein